jgi:MarR family transcriptional regulator, lower aerobic nicotinate degradation pathway regulator
MKNSSVIPLLNQWEIFIEENPKKDIYAFAHWLLAGRQEQNKETITSDEENNMGSSVQVAILITQLRSYLGLYVKPTVKTLGFTKEHEYNFLYQVSRMDKPNKNELSKENMVEFSTGRDIIRRLVAKKLITEKVDPNDKRASQLYLTPKGKNILKKSFEMISGNFTDFLGDLTVREKDQLTDLLGKVNKYHALKNNREILSYL